MRETGVLSDATWVMLAFVYIAESGLNYRRYLRGDISPTQFWTTTSLLSLTTAEGLLGGAGGVAIGFALGTMLLPGVGGLIGSVVGGLAGGFAGDKVMLRSYQELENRLLHVYPRKVPAPTQEDFDLALEALKSQANDDLLTIENRFFEMQHAVSEQLESARQAKDEVLALARQSELNRLYHAYQTVRAKKHYTEK